MQIMWYHVHPCHGSVIPWSHYPHRGSHISRTFTPSHLHTFTLITHISGRISHTPSHPHNHYPPRWSHISHTFTPSHFTPSHSLPTSVVAYLTHLHTLTLHTLTLITHLGGRISHTPSHPHTHCPPRGSHISHTLTPSHLHTHYPHVATPHISSRTRYTTSNWPPYTSLVVRGPPLRATYTLHTDLLSPTLTPSPLSLHRIASYRSCDGWTTAILYGFSTFSTQLETRLE